MHKVRFARDWTSKNTLKQEIQVYISSFYSGLSFYNQLMETLSPGPWYVQYFYALFVDEELHFKDSAYYCYCASVLRISRYSDFLSSMLTNTGIFLHGLKLSGESTS